MINWKIRFKNPVFYIQLIVSIISSIFAYMGITASEITSWYKLFEIIRQAFSNPYIIFICDFVLEFFDNIDHMPISGDFGNFYGLNDGLNEDEINFMEKIFIFRKITNKKRYEIINKFVRKDLVVEKLSWIKGVFFGLFIKKIERYQLLTK